MSNKEERCGCLLDLCDAMWEIRDYGFEQINTVLNRQRDITKDLMDIDLKNGIYVYTLLFNYLTKVRELQNEAGIIADELECLHNTVEMEKE